MFNPAEALRDNPALFACYVLFIYFRGRNAVRIEREMRALGHATFHRRNLYPRGRQPGWIAKYGWQHLSVPPALAGGSTQPIDRQRELKQDEQDRHDAKGGNPTGWEGVPPAHHQGQREPIDVPYLNHTLHPAHPVSIPSNDFHGWLKRVSPTMTWDWRHQQVIIEQLNKVTSGDCKRLMIFLPPRHGKSELVSVRYTAWRMQQRPELNVILGSYNQRLADKMSRKIRTVVCDAEAIRLGRTQRRMSVPPAVAGGSSQPIKTSSNEFNSTDLSQQGRFTPALDPSQLSGGKPAVQTENGSVDTEISQDSRQECDRSEIVRSQLSTVNSSPFPFSRPRPKNAVSEWETASGGSFRAVGSGAGVTGFGANLIVIDDPVKNRAQAESETFRNRVWDWYKDDLYTRLEPDGSIVLIQTRWHEDDLAGRLLRDDLDNWTIINLPALSEPGTIATGSVSEVDSESEPQIDADQRKYMSVPPEVAGGSTETIETQGIPTNSTDLSQEGRLTPALETEQYSGGKRAFPTAKDLADRSDQPSEIPHSALRIRHSFDWRQAPNIALCPERFPVEALEQQRRQLGTYSFSALYQQRPTPAGGEIFKREWFKNIIDSAPPGLKWKRGYDLAVSTKTESDYTASFRCAFDKESNLYISGGFRRRIEFPEQRRYIIDRMLNERDTEHGVELALHGQALLQDLRRDPSIRGRSLSGVKVSTDKLTRALTWSPLAEEGKVILVRNTDFGMRNEMHKPARQQGRYQDLAALHDAGDTEISPRPARRQTNASDATPGIRHSEFRTPHSAWIDDLLDELTAFPNGTHDDQVDAISLAVQMLAKREFKSKGFLIP
ncbi:MAG: terminase family protein [Pyrinomonadaceae bacterium]